MRKVDCGSECGKRVQAGRSGWRKVAGVICDRRILAKMKGKLYKTVVRPAILYGVCILYIVYCMTVALTGKQEMELEVAQLKML